MLTIKCIHIHINLNVCLFLTKDDMFILKIVLVMLVMCLHKKVGSFKGGSQGDFSYTYGQDWCSLCRRNKSSDVKTKNVLQPSYLSILCMETIRPESHIIPNRLRNRIELSCEER